MGKKKIIVVDVVDTNNDNDSVTIDDNQKTTPDTPDPEVPIIPETANITDTKDEYIKEKDIKYEDINSDVKEIENEKKTREQILIKCEKCNKFVTAKTLRYTHGVKCGEVKRSRPKKVNEKVQPDTTHKAVKVEPAKAVSPPPGLETPQTERKTYEDMRRERLTERLKHRAEHNIQLFKQVL